MSATPGAFAQPTKCKCYATKSLNGAFEPHEITRRGCTDNDVVIAVKYAGICHSDIHTVKEEWGPVVFPIVPGHEIAGHVVAVGKNVNKFTVGQTVGVGCMVGSCSNCPSCLKGEEQWYDWYL